MTPSRAEPVSSARPAARGTPQRSRLRGVASLTTLVLFGLLAPVTLVTGWVGLTLLDTERYVETVGPLASDDAVRQAAAAAVSSAVMARVESSRVLSTLPLTGEDVERAAGAALDTDAFRAIWSAANREAHRQLVDLLTGEDSDGQVVVDLGAIVTELDVRFEVAGRDVDLGASLGETPVTLTVFESDQLEAARRWVRLLDRLAVALPVATLALVAGGILLDDRRWRAMRRVGVALATGMATFAAAVLASRFLYLDALGADVPRDAASAVFDSITRSLWIWTIGLALAGCAIALAARRQEDRVAGRMLAA